LQSNLCVCMCMCWCGCVYICSHVCVYRIYMCMYVCMCVYICEGKHTLRNDPVALLSQCKDHIQFDDMDTVQDNALTHNK